MRARWRLSSLAYWAVVTVVLAAIVHISTVILLPYVTPDTAWRRLAPMLAENRMVVLPAVSPDAQPVAFLAPDVRYAMCRFNIARGALTVKARLPGPTWSLALYTPQGDGYFKVGAGDLQRLDLDMTINPPQERSLLDAAQAMLLRTPPREARGQRDSALAVTAPTHEGLLVIRAPLMGLAFQQEAEEALAQARCTLVRRGP